MERARGGEEGGAVTTVTDFNVDEFLRQSRGSPKALLFTASAGSLPNWARIAVRCDHCVFGCAPPLPTVAPTRVPTVQDRECRPLPPLSAWRNHCMAACVVPPPFLAVHPLVSPAAHHAAGACRCVYHTQHRAMRRFGVTASMLPVVVGVRPDDTLAAHHGAIEAGSVLRFVDELAPEGSVGVLT